MEDIYRILSKHFLKETTQKEEELIGKFKKENPKEYLVLSQIWEKGGEIKIKFFDAVKGWESVVKNSSISNTKIIPFYTLFRRIAAVAAILITSALTVYFLSDRVKQSETQISQLVNDVKGKEILLSDGSKVWLNDNAIFSYPEKFTGNEREVSLKGEAFFEITKDPLKPFIIKTIHSNVRVLGTSFNINTNSTQTEVSVATGKVAVMSVFNNKSITITPGFSAIANNESISSCKSNLNFLSWKTGVFSFNETPIQQVISDLNSYYSDSITIENSTLDCKLTANFNNIDLKYVLETLELTCMLKTEITNEIIVLKQ